jgi:solute carrier family 8 (sodium/calcium exchanger)
LEGDDTVCKVTILDEDFPGTLGFENTEIRVAKGQDHVDIGILRSDGSDGTISCVIKTE